MAVHHDEAQIIKQAQAGDREAFAVLHDRHWEAIYNYVYYRVNSAAEAEDITSEVFVRMVEKIDRYQRKGKPFLAWLYTIARNIVIDFYRSNERTPTLEPLDENLATNDNDPAEAANRSLIVNCLRRALRRLTELQRDVIVGKFIEGRTNKDLAAVLGRTIGAIKSIQHRALASLHKAIEEEGCYES